MFKSLWWRSRVSEKRYQRERSRIIRDAPIPVFWLLGKTGSGKTSVVKYLTGVAEAEIGNGFRPQTRTARQYDFPAEENPLMRFLDTRGLGEGGYDATGDIEQFADETSLVLVTVRALDHALEEVIEPLKQLRRAAPGRPVLLALTWLHEAYPQQQHPRPDPFDDDDRDDGAAPADWQVPAALPEDLRRSLDQQRTRFAGLVDRIVAIDLTRPEEGMDEPNFGGPRLRTALLELLPAALRQTLLTLDEAMRPLKSLNDRRAMPALISYSIMAGTAGAVPLPWVDIPIVAALQTHLVMRLAKLYNQPLDKAMVGRLTGVIGGHVIARVLVGSSLKLIPYAGIAANAALAFAYTFAIGKACCWYFGQVRLGNAPTDEELRRVWTEQLGMAQRLWQHRGRFEQQDDNS